MALFGATRLRRLALALLATLLSHAVPRRYPYTNLTLTDVAGAACRSGEAREEKPGLAAKGRGSGSPAGLLDRGGRVV